MHTEVSHETSRGCFVGASWGSHGTDKSELVHISALQALGTVEATRVDDLSEHLKGGSGTILLLGGHVQIINKDKQVVHGVLRSEDTPGMLLKIALAIALDLCWSRGG